MAASAIEKLGSRLLKRLVEGQLRGMIRRQLGPVPFTPLPLPTKNVGGVSGVSATIKNKTK